jgi:L-ascorbate oxidase
MAILVNGNSAEAKSEPGADDASLECAPELIQVAPATTYRFRTIDAAALSGLIYGIEDHDELTIIEADGRYTQPAVVDRLVTGSGQRFDYLLKTKTEAELESLGKRNFWIQIEIRDRPVNYTSYACLSYDGQGCGPVPAQDSPVISLPRDTTTWLEYTLQPLLPNAFPALSEVTRRITIYADQVNISGSLVWHLNDEAISVDTPRSSPYLVDIYKNGNAAIPSLSAADATNTNTSNYDATLNAYFSPLKQVLEIIWIQRPNFPAGGFDAHPLHAHGGHYHDIGAGPGSYDPVANEARFANYTPALRDTTMLHRYTASPDTPEGVDQGWRGWRIRVEDAGVWLLHCHTLQHMIMGMQTVWVMGEAEDIVRAGTPVGMLEGYLDYGGSAYGKEGKDPVVNHWFDAHEEEGRWGNEHFRG